MIRLPTGLRVASPFGSAFLPAQQRCPGSVGFGLVPCPLSLACLNSRMPFPPGLSTARSPWDLPSSWPICTCMPRPEDPGSLPRPHQTGRFPWTSCSLTHSSTATSSFSGLYQHFREYGLPYGLQASLCTLHLPCSRSSQSPYHSGAPPQAQHSIRVGGWPLPDGDLHPARYAKLRLAQ